MAEDEGAVTLRYGAVYARTLPPTREGSLWAHIAIVNFPGWPLVLDQYCQPGRLWFVDTKQWRVSSVNP